MNRRDFLKWCGKGLAIAGTSMIPMALKEKKVDAFVVDESSIPKWKLHNTDCIDALKEYCTKDAELAWDMYQNNIWGNIGRYDYKSRQVIANLIKEAEEYIPIKRTWRFGSKKINE